MMMFELLGIKIMHTSSLTLTIWLIKTIKNSYPNESRKSETERRT